jgi:hypothetical protein
VLEETETCKFGKLTVDGGKSSNLKDTTLPMLRTTKYLMFKATETLKDKMSSHGESTTD